MVWRERLHFFRAASELGIKLIHAHSPQAKGRIERSFRTLQDRLVKDMRLVGIRTCDEANRFLEHWLSAHNRRFARKTLEPGDLHRRLPKSVRLEDILCIKGFRTVNEGCLIKWRGRTFVLERFDGSLSLRFKGRDLAYREVREPLRAAPKPVESKPRPKPPKYIPPPSHPWRRSLFWNGRLP